VNKVEPQLGQALVAMPLASSSKFSINILYYQSMGVVKCLSVSSEDCVYLINMVLSKARRSISLNLPLAIEISVLFFLACNLCEKFLKHICKCFHINQLPLGYFNYTKTLPICQALWVLPSSQTSFAVAWAFASVRLTLIMLTAAAPATLLNTF